MSFTSLSALDVALSFWHSCQLDTHLNDATPRPKEKTRDSEPQETWQLPPTLQHRNSHPSQHTAGDKSQKEHATQRPDVPGTIQDTQDEEARGESVKWHTDIWASIHHFCTIHARVDITSAMFPDTARR